MSRVKDLEAQLKAAEQSVVDLRAAVGAARDGRVQRSALERGSFYKFDRNDTGAEADVYMVIHPHGLTHYGAAYDFMSVSANGGVFHTIGDPFVYPCKNFNGDLLDTKSDSV